MVSANNKSSKAFLVPAEKKQVEVINAANSVK